jgi:hypothetical protein
MCRPTFGYFTAAGWGGAYKFSIYVFENPRDRIIPNMEISDGLQLLFRKCRDADFSR